MDSSAQFRRASSESTLNPSSLRKRVNASRAWVSFPRAWYAAPISKAARTALGCAGAAVRNRLIAAGCRYGPPARWHGIEAEPALVCRRREDELTRAVVDALLGTGLEGPPQGRMATLIREINDGFSRADVVAVDMPSGMQSDTGRVEGDVVTADE